MERASQEARVEEERLLNAARCQSEQQKQERLAGVRRAIEEEIRLDPNDQQRLVTGVIRAVCGQAQPSEELP